MSLPILISILILISLLFYYITIKVKQSIRVFHSDRKRVRDLTEKITLLGQKLPSDSTYFRFSTLEEILREASDIKSQLQTINHAFLREKVKTAIATLAQIETSLPRNRNQINELFFEKELERCRDILFDESGKSLLTDEQARAVLVDDNRNLIIAGAGSGKTRVIDFKVRYLVNHKKVDSRKIILLSFSKKSANDLILKISKSVAGVEAKTIHSFSSQLIKDQKKEVFNENNKQQALLVINALVETLKDQIAFRMFNEFYEKSFSEIKPLIFYKTIDDLRNDLKKSNSKLIAAGDQFEEIILNKNLKTLKGDFVRSVDERYIADFLYLQNIDYIYEKKYDLSKVVYHPDFYLPDYDVYFEHFALTETGQPPPYFENPQRYLDGIAWKREEHKKNNTKMIESFSYLLNGGNTSEYLSQLFKENGIDLKIQEADEALYEKISKEFSRFFNRFYSSYKLSGFSLVELKERINDPRCKLFLKFFEKFMVHYELLVKNENKMDFSDMIIDAVDHCRKNPLDSFDYIIVDEFQDTSNLAMKLLNEVYRGNPKATFFSVGDDWQSIYGFNGSDVSILSEYEESYKGVSVQKMNSNFRSHSRIVDLGKCFISKNPYQISKDVVSKNNKYEYSNIDFLTFNYMEDRIESIPDNESIFVLYRYNDDCPAYKGIFEKYFEYDKNRKPIRRKSCRKNISLMTIHSSKGLEAQHVFVLFPDGVRRKFPSEIDDHFVFSMLKNNSEDYPFAEERRLMYVAITRAEQNLYFVSQNNKEPQSIFWDELIQLTNHKIS